MPGVAGLSRTHGTRNDPAGKAPETSRNKASTEGPSPVEISDQPGLDWYVAKRRRIGAEVHTNSATADPADRAYCAFAGSWAAGAAGVTSGATAGRGVFIIVPVIGMKNTPTSLRECTLPSSSFV